MKNRFREYVSKVKEAIPTLPITHTCDGYNFNEIYEDSRIRTSSSEDFRGQSLVHFFYGRPAYRPKSWKKAQSRLAFMPCSFVVESKVITDPVRIYPFDSGAWDRVRSNALMHPEIERDDFLLHNSMDMPARLVNRFFRTNDDYYHGRYRNLRIPALQFEAQSYYELIKHPSTQSLDDRTATIEIQYDNPIDLTSHNVLFVVLPEDFYKIPRIQKKIVNEWKAIAGVYKVQSITPKEHMGIVVEAVNDFLIQMGRL